MSNPLSNWLHSKVEEVNIPLVEPPPPNDIEHIKAEMAYKISSMPLKERADPTKIVGKEVGEAEARNAGKGEGEKKG
jgi:hypothetical protein